MNVTGTETDARSHAHIDSSITAPTGISLHRVVTGLCFVARTSSISQKNKRHRGVETVAGPRPVTELQWNTGFTQSSADAVMWVSLALRMFKNIKAVCE